MMNLTSIESELKNILSHYHAPTMRYQNLAFSSKSFAVLEELSNHLIRLLPNYRVWHGQQPNKNATPTVPCYRQEFIAKMLKDSNTGLIIQYPHYWQQAWPLLDKQAFWSTFSTTHGGQPMIVLFTEGYDFAQINQHYLIPHPLESIAATLWVSSKTSLV